jgi:hypothetical protein
MRDRMTAADVAYRVRREELWDRLVVDESGEGVISAAIRPGSLEHLYPEPRPERSGSDAGSDSSVSASNAT